MKVGATNMTNTPEISKELGEIMCAEGLEQLRSNTLHSLFIGGTKTK